MWVGGLLTSAERRFSLSSPFRLPSCRMNIQLRCPSLKSEPSTFRYRPWPALALTALTETSRMGWWNCAVPRLGLWFTRWQGSSWPIPTLKPESGWVIWIQSEFDSEAEINPYRIPFAFHPESQISLKLAWHTRQDPHEWTESTAAFLAWCHKQRNHLHATEIWPRTSPNKHIFPRNQSTRILVQISRHCNGPQTITSYSSV